MATPFVNVKMSSFFDRRGIAERMGKKERKVLIGAGAFGRTAVKRSIRKAPKKKQITSGPPRFHVRGRESLKDRIFFGYDVRSNSVVVGPELFNAGGGGKGGSLNYRLSGGINTVPELLEKGGVRTVFGRGRGRNFRGAKRITRQTYRPRPYVGPQTASFKTAADKLADLMAKTPL
jgi:hypothetical protein